MLMKDRGRSGLSDKNFCYYGNNLKGDNQIGRNDPNEEAI